jgi:hypothetical protein
MPAPSADAAGAAVQAGAAGHELFFDPLGASVLGGAAGHEIFIDPSAAALLAGLFGLGDNMAGATGNTLDQSNYSVGQLQTIGNGLRMVYANMNAAWAIPTVLTEIPGLALTIPATGAYLCILSLSHQTAFFATGQQNSGVQLNIHKMPGNVLVYSGVNVWSDGLNHTVAGTFSLVFIKSFVAGDIVTPQCLFTGGGGGSATIQLPTGFGAIQLTLS